MRAIGDDDQIEWPVCRTASIHDRGGRPLGEDIGDLAADPQARRRALQALMQELEQHAAQDAEPVRLGMQVGIGKLEHRAPAMGPALQPVDARAARHGLVHEPKRAQHGEASRLQQQPGADRPRLGEALENRDGMAGIGQQGGDCLAGYTAADDGDPQSHGNQLGSLRRHCRSASNNNARILRSGRPVALMSS